MELPQFERTECRCPECASFCFASPGGLTPSDLPNIVPKTWDGSYDLAWCLENLLLSFDTMVVSAAGIVHIPVLIPGFRAVKEIDGETYDALCIFLDDEGDCTIHDHSPWGCRMFGGSLSTEEGDRRSRAMINEIILDGQSKGPYMRIVEHLAEHRKVAPPKAKRIAHREHTIKQLNAVIADKARMN